MPCEVLNCCRLFGDKMQGMPKTAAYIKEKLCLNDYESCPRYRILTSMRKDLVPFELHPDDTEEFLQTMQCVRITQPDFPEHREDCHSCEGERV